MDTRKSVLLRQILLAATLAVGFGTVWFALVIWIGTSIHGASRGQNPGSVTPPREALLVKADGTPLVAKYANGLSTQATYRDLEGGEQEYDERRSRIPEIAMPGEHEPPGLLGSRLDWSQRIESFLDEKDLALNWYFIHNGESEGGGYFVGYENVSNRLVGYIGLSGSRPDPVPASERIPVRAALMTGYSLWSSAPLWAFSSRNYPIRVEPWDLPPRLVHVPSGNSVRVVDLSAKTIRTVFEAPEPIESVGIPGITIYSGAEAKKELPIHVRTKRKIYSLDHRYKSVGVFDIPAEIDTRSRAVWYDIGDGRSVVAFERPWSRGEGQHLTHRVIYRLNPDGSIRDRFVRDFLNGVDEEDERFGLMLLSLGLPSPMPLVTIGAFGAMSAGRTQSFPDAIGTMLKLAWPSIVAVLALSSFMAAVALRRGRAFGYSRRERVTWAVFVLLLGLPAYAGFLLHRRWPARQPCPSCRANVARDREACAECGTLFPEPSPRGIEVFA